MVNQLSNVTVDKGVQCGRIPPMNLRLPAQDCAVDKQAFAEKRVKDTHFAAVGPLFAPSERSGKSWDDFAASWNDLGADGYHEGACRRRTFSTFLHDAEAGVLVVNKHHPLFQPAKINVLNGGFYRDFQPIAAEVLEDAHFLGAVEFGLTLATRLEKSAGRATQWYIEAHQFRVIALSELAGAPTPEGIHRDGRDYVSMMFINSQNVEGGKSSVYNDASDQSIASLRLDTPSDTLFVADRKVRHSVSLMMPVADGISGHRDMLIFSYTNLAHPDSLGRWVVPELIADAEAA